MGRPQKYPWDDWFSKEEFTIRAGKEVPADKDLGIFRTQLLAEARRRGLEIATRIEMDDNEEPMLVVGPAADDWVKGGVGHWLDGQQHRLEPGVDFKGSGLVMAENLRTHATRRKLDVRIVVEDERIVHVKSYGPFPTKKVCEWLESLPNGEYQASRLQAMVHQHLGRGSYISPYQLSMLLQWAGFTRRRTTYGSMWSKRPKPPPAPPPPDQPVWNL